MVYHYIGIMLEKPFIQALSRYLVLFIALASISCSGPNPGGEGQEGDTVNPALSENTTTGVLRNPLRVIVRPEPVSFLPRNAEPVRIDREIAQGLAEFMDREYVPVVVSNYADMIDQLQDGKADLIAASMTITGPRSEQVLFSIPYLHVDELLIVPDGEDQAGEWRNLDGKTICVREGSSYEETLEELRESGIDLSISRMSEMMNTEEIVDLVVEGVCPATVVDTHYWSAINRFYEGVQSLRALAEARPVALAVDPGNTDLKQQIDNYLTIRALTGEREYFFTDDLPDLKKRRRLRMITRNSAVTYYLYRGSPFGFEYELLERFAGQQGLHLEIVIPPDNESLIPWLNEGRGDVVAAMLTLTAQRQEQAAATRPYFYSDEVVVIREDDNVESITDLAGRTVHVRQSSSYYRTLQELQQQVNGMIIDPAPEEMQTSEILRRVEEGEWDITIANRELLQIEQTYGHKLKAAFSLSENDGLAWYVRDTNPELMQALNEFISEEYRGLFYNLRKARYFENRKFITRAESEWRLDQGGVISPYDDLVKKYATRHELDWRLIVSQMYQESRFEHDLESWAGARGVMQLLPRAAREVGVKKLNTPEQSIKAGIRYLRRMIDLFDPRLPLETRIRFGLASYNAGRGHVLDARRLARQQGLSPDIWYDNVETAMLLLSDPKYYRKARFGFVKGEEPVNYVRQIEARYLTYVNQLSQ